jgi:serine/threonine protein kinase
MQEGDRLDHFEILGLLGRAAWVRSTARGDTTLDREVALKVLPDDLARDPERLARFQREARLLAALNHSNIATIHGLAEADGKLFLSMELAGGQTLAERIDRGAMAVDEAIDVALQVASGLEAAHGKGIVHRDLKPANVALGPDGAVKILDFGLARAYQDDAAAVNDPENSPTLTAAMTGAGVILGTAAYMSPEQARGAAIDARSDIWSFGVILWELLAGRRLFAGETVSDTLAMVLRGEPDWDALPAEAPTRLRRLVQRCLQRDRRQRLHHIADARILLQEIKQDPGTEALPPPDRGPAARAARLGWPAAAVLAVVAAVLGWQALDRQSPPQSRPGRFDLTLPSDTWLAGFRQSLAVSPSGDAFVVSLVTAGDRQLFLRTLDDPAFVPIAGTERATTPFFSPDGRWLAFTQDGWLRKIPREGGSPMDLSRCEWGGGDWTSDGRIIFTRSYASGLDVVSAAGGQARTLTEPEPAQGELGHWWPQLLPGEDWVVYTSWSTPIDRARIVAQSLVSDERRVLVEGGAFGRWSPTGHLLFVRGGQLLAAPLDLKRMVLAGNAEPVLDDIYLNSNDGYANLSFGRDGTLVYAPASVMETPRRLVWVPPPAAAATPADSSGARSRPASRARGSAGPRPARVARRDQGPQLDRGLGHVGHHDLGHAAVPALVVLDEALQLLAQRLDRHRVVDVQEDRAEQIGRDARPVLERRLDEVGDRHHEPPLVPDAHHDVGQRDLLDAPPLALDDDHVVEADRLGDRDLDARRTACPATSGPRSPR